MLNKIWFWLLLIGILYGFGKGSYQSIDWYLHGAASAPVTAPAAAVAKPQAADSAVDAAKKAAAKEPGLTAMGKRLNAALVESASGGAEYCLGLIGIMTLWLGLMNIAKDAGLIDAFARLMRPLIRWLFPEVPDGHAAQGSMLMNFAANMFGLDNAATPMGLKAMEDLQTLNPRKDTATNSMALFLAINCGSITLIPITIIGFRAIKGSENPSGILIGTWMASFASVVAGITVARLLARSSKYRVEPIEASGDVTGTEEDSR